MAPQFDLEHRNFLMMEYHKKKGGKNFLPDLLHRFRVKFPGIRLPATSTIRRIFGKQLEKGTVLNCNSATSPGLTNSGRRRTSRTIQNRIAVKQVMDRDAQKHIGDANVSPVSSCRLSAVHLDKSTWWRLKCDLKYHPYRPIRRHQLKPADLPRRLVFCQWLITRTDPEMMEMLVSDEAYFQLNGLVNSQNVRRYAPLKSANPAQGGRPGHFAVETPTFDTKIMVFCGMNRDGTFGLRVFRDGTLNGPGYHSLLQYHVMPELRRWNGGNLDRLWWQQDGATVHVTDRNMRYLDTLFGARVISRRPIRGIDWPARSPDLSPLDFCLWGYLKSKVLL